jgi:hypothetical protein
MRDDERCVAFRVMDETTRQMAVEVLRATYHREKKWVTDAEQQLPANEIARDNVSWFVVTRRGLPAGVVRVLYDPPLAQYAKYGLKGVDPALNVESFLRDNRVAEIGRFAVTRRYRRSIMVAAALMRAAAEDTIARGYTHYVTDVFEDDPHSPYGFHTRVMGFLPVATHDTGELKCDSRRITLLLDLRAAYRRLKERGNWFYRYLTGSWDEALHKRLAT